MLIGAVTHIIDNHHIMRRVGKVHLEEYEYNKEEHQSLCGIEFDWDLRETILYYDMESLIWFAERHSNMCKSCKNILMKMCNDSVKTI